MSELYGVSQNVEKDLLKALRVAPDFFLEVTYVLNFDYVFTNFSHASHYVNSLVDELLNVE